MNISDTFKKNTKANPKIHDLHLQTREVLVYGVLKICRVSQNFEKFLLKTHVKS